MSVVDGAIGVVDHVAPCCSTQDDRPPCPEHRPPRHMGEESEFAHLDQTLTDRVVDGEGAGFGTIVVAISNIG